MAKSTYDVTFDGYRELALELDDGVVVSARSGDRGRQNNLCIVVRKALFEQNPNARIDRIEWDQLQLVRH